MIKVTFQEALMIGTCAINIQERWELKNIQGEAATTALNALNYFSGCIYVEKTPEQCCLGYRNSQKAREGV